MCVCVYMCLFVCTCVCVLASITKFVNLPPLVAAVVVAVAAVVAVVAAVAAVVAVCSYHKRNGLPLSFVSHIMLAMHFYLFHSLSLLLFRLKKSFKKNLDSRCMF